MFVDTSVIVAILSNEDDAAEWSRRLAVPGPKFSSAVVVLEAAMRLSTLLNVEPEEAEEGIRLLLKQSEIQVIPVGDREASAAVTAFARFGKGRGHPARLNLADCLSYACAKVRDIPLLYKGNDFPKTDIG